MCIHFTLNKTKNETTIYTNVLLLTSENDISVIFYSLFSGRQNNFLTIFSTKFVVKCAAENLKIGLQIQKDKVREAGLAAL